MRQTHWATWAASAASLGVLCSLSCPEAAASFRSDLELLRKHTDVLVLSDRSREAQVAVCPSMQGRVMTSTGAGLDGLSFGWINHEVIAAQKPTPHITVYGGEDRFWVGPEGGQFSVFFKPGVPFDLDHWFVPAFIDTEPFRTVSRASDRARFTREVELENYSRTRLSVRADREVRLLDWDEAKAALGVTPPRSVKMVAFESENKMTNVGKNAWVKETGLLSIWILGMFNPSPSTTIVIPFKPGPEATVGPIVNDAYFGKVPAERLVVKEKEGVLFFKGDGQQRGKIGIPPRRAKPILGSYDAANKALTIVQYTLPPNATDYVNSMWEIQKQPYAGDVANSYNDGPPAPGAKPLGPFYELESSSPAAALKPGEAITHVHRTFHIQGSEKDLDVIAKALLGVSTAEIAKALR